MTDWLAAILAAGAIGLRYTAWAILAWEIQLVLTLR